MLKVEVEGNKRTLEVREKRDRGPRWEQKRRVDGQTATDGFPWSVVSLAPMQPAASR